MADPTGALLAELKVLRKGRGVDAPRLLDQVGPTLRQLCGVRDEDPDEVARRKVITRLGDLAGTLPADLALAATAALGLSPQTRQPFLSERVQWVAERLDRDVRTARRRVDDGLERLAGLAAQALLEDEGATGLCSHPPGPPAGDWYVAAFHALLHLDLPNPEVLERREIVAERDGLDRIDALVSLPRDPTASGQQDLTMHVLKPFGNPPIP